MSDYKIIYDKSRFPKRQRREDGTYGCRGCGSDIPKGRKSWCSKKCYNTFEPSRVIHAVKLRDKGICQMCSFDIETALKAWQHRYWERSRQSGQDYATWPEWKSANPKPPKANYDHIIPFSEGGMTILENMRTLCEPCHKERTKKWHKERKKNPKHFSGHLPSSI